MAKVHTFFSHVEVQILVEKKKKEKRLVKVVIEPN